MARPHQLSKSEFRELWASGVCIWRRVAPDPETVGAAMARFFPGKRMPDKAASYHWKAEDGTVQKYAFDMGGFWLMVSIGCADGSGQVRVANNKAE